MRKDGISIQRPLWSPASLLNLKKPLLNEQRCGDIKILSKGWECERLYVIGQVPCLVSIASESPKLDIQADRRVESELKSPRTQS